jgi:ubiquinone biosynthesis protein
MMVAEGVARALDPGFDIWAASRPAVEQWMVQSVGPEARLRDAADGLEALSRAAQHLPRLVRDAEAVSQMLSEGGLRLHPDTMRHFAEVQIRRAKHLRIAIWTGAVALALLVVGLWFSR